MMGDDQRCHWHKQGCNEIPIAEVGIISLQQTPNAIQWSQVCERHLRRETSVPFLLGVAEASADINAVITRALPERGRPQHATPGPSEDQDFSSGSHVRPQR